MTNITNPQRTWVLDTTGIITQVHIRIRRVVWHVNNDGDQLALKTWDESDTPTQAKTSATMDSVNVQEFESTGNWPQSTINPGQIVKFTKTSTGNNERAFLIATNADNNNITVAAAQDPDEEDGEIYNWNVFEARDAIYAMSQGADYTYLVFEAHERAGRFFPNLCLSTLSGGTVYIDIA